MDQAARGLDRRSPSATVTTVVLLGAGAGYGGGNIGPVTGAIAGRFGVSLSAVGLTMSVFFATITAVTIGSAQILRRLGPRPAIASCCLLAGLGNVVCAVSPSFAGVLVGRGVVGLGAGLAFVIGPVVACAHGGARTVGAFGAAVTLGVAIALAVGRCLPPPVSAGEWRSWSQRSSAPPRSRRCRAGCPARPAISPGDRASLQPRSRCRRCGG